MTKETLKWRLTKLPTSEEVLKLLNEKLISKDEARDILFSIEKTTKTPDGETHILVKEEDLKSEIKFLRELVEKLSKQEPSRIVQVIRDVEIRYRTNPWYQPYQFYCTTTGGLTGVGATSSTTLAGNNSQLSSSLVDSFTNVKTF